MRRAAVIALAILVAAVPARAAIDLLLGNALYDPVVAGDMERVERQLATGTWADMVLDGEEKTALMLASTAGNDAMVELLLRYKAKPDLRDSVGNTALAYAANRGHREAVEALLRGRATIDLENRQGVTPLMQAAEQGRSEVVRLLLAKGADPAKRDYTGRTALMWAELNRRNAVITVFKHAGVKE